MSNRVSKIFQYLRDKLYSFLGFVKFIVVPKSNVFKAILVGSVVFFVFGSVIAVKAAPDPGLMDQVIGLINILLFYVAYALGWVAMKVFALIVWVSQYNDFVTSPAVTKGWVLVRDICNMFFVVILLVIAFAQILGVQKYSMKTLLPKVLIAAILVNFSKLLCGLMIDLAQVVMMTFVNGFQATAGANLINGLGLTRLLQLNDQATSNGGGTGPAPSQILLALVIAIFIIIATIFVSFFIVLLLLLRIVTLWILVVLSPAAFALSTVPFGQSKYNEWWQKFGWNVAVGPFMAFFLWLSLLIMSSPEDMMGSNTNMTDAAQGIDQRAGTGAGSISYLNNIAQAAIGLAMLFASLIIAQEAGGAMGSLAQKGQKATTGALQSVAMRASGAKFVADRGKAAYSGYKQLADAKKTAKMDKYKRFGQKTFEGKENRLRNVKKALPYTVASGVGAVKGVGKSAVAAYKEASANGGGALKGIKAALGSGIRGKGGFAGAKKQLQREKVLGSWGNTNGVMAANAKKSRNKDLMDKAKESLDARNVSSPEDLRALLQSKTANKAERKQAALMLAQKGKHTAESAKVAKKVLAGDDDAMATHSDALKKKQAQFAYDTEKDENGKQVLTTAAQGKLTDDLKNGDVDATKLDESAYADPKIMSVISEALGAKRFQSQMEKVKERGPGFETAVNDSMMHRVGDASVAASTAATVAAANPRDVDAQNKSTAATKAFEDLQIAAAKITGMASQAFATRDATGSTGGVVKLDGASITRLGQAIGEGRITGKEIKEFDFNDPAMTTPHPSKDADGNVVNLSAMQHITKNISVNQLAEMGQHKNLNVIVKQMVSEGQNLEGLASNEKIMGAVTDKDTLEALRAVKASVQQQAAAPQVAAVESQQAVLEQIRDSLKTNAAAPGGPSLLDQHGRPISSFS